MSILTKISSYFKKTPDSKPMNKWKKRAIIMGGIFLFLYLLVEHNFLGLIGAVPGLAELKNPPMSVASEVYTEDGKLLCRFYKENRLQTDWEEIPDIFKKGLVTVEDIRFFEHSGIDWQANFSIFWYMIKGDRRGASTITQQLAKNLFDMRKSKNQGLLAKLPGFRMFLIKLREWITAVKLENVYSKEEILHLYINTVDYGGNHFGLKTAARAFFDKSPDSLSVEECAVLIGVLKAPTTYNPILHPDACQKRRNVVLQLMMEHNLISSEYFERVKLEPVIAKAHIEDIEIGSAVYFRLAVEKYLNDWCVANGYDLYSDGLKIYTTLDSKLQVHAEEAVKEHLSKLQKTFFRHWGSENPWMDSKKVEIPNFLEDAIKITPAYKALRAKFKNQPDSIEFHLHQPKRMKVFTWNGDRDTTFSSYDSLKYYKMILQAGFITMDPHTGYVKTWVGSNDYRYFRYDHINQSKRQPGSTFKPFVYCTALEKGMHPCDTRVDKYFVHHYVEEGEEKTWNPRNADRVYTDDVMTLRFAMGRSINSIAAQLTIELTPDTVVKYAHKLGIESDLKPVPSVGLGSNVVSLYEMISSYTAFMNEGKRNTPILVKEIRDKNNETIATFEPLQEQVISPETAWFMTYMLRGTLEEPKGTSQALFQHGDVFYRNHLGGKTGTSSNHADGWYMGVTKDLIGGVWVGADDQTIHFRTSALGEGMKTALPVWGYFLQRVYADKESGIVKSYFNKPPKGLDEPYCPTILRVIPDSSAVDSNVVVEDIVIP